ncbi:uncharacterized protein [Rutidosis leptorrhynchoides]|uniref:uncharacterized protein n=1 Tax=Rutidosis leptorrhynchoides TaxID=125765 RepID=UPI003A991017
MEVWDRVFKWWNMGNFENFSLGEIFNIEDSHSLSCFGLKLWQALRWVTAYLILSNRNNMVFNGKAWNAPVALNEIQIKSFEWLSNRAKGKKIEWHTWVHNPIRVCSILAVVLIGDQLLVRSLCPDVSL